MRACSQCHQPNPDHARFCSKCGAILEPSAASVDPLIGHVVADRYRLVRAIGEGGMGRVYLAEQRMGTVVRAVAVKVLTTSMSDQIAVTRFYRECETVVQLTHPNTIRFYDFGSIEVVLPGGAVDRRLYIAMEYVDGRSLAAAIEAGPMAIDAVDRIVREVGGALTEAHRRGIVHRDLKPENVLLAANDADGEIAKVCDFGIAKREQTGQAEITAQGTIIGTPAYMSPEQITGLEVDERSDVYALALMTYEMITGSRPFVARTPLEWATAHMTETPRAFELFPAARALSPERRAAILHGLVKDPAKRTPSVRAFVEEFTGLDPRLASTPPGARAAASPSRAVDEIAKTSVATLGAKRSFAPTLAAIAALALFAGAAIGMWAIYGDAGGTSALAAPPDAGAAIDAGIDGGPPEPEWLTILQYEDKANDATLALGAPDGRCARVRVGGTIQLELTPGVRIETDGTPSADLSVVVSAEDSSAYRLDVGVERHQWTTIAQGLVGSTPLDVDQFSIDRFRYVRIKNRSSSGTVCIDAVGAFRYETPPAE